MSKFIDLHGTLFFFLESLDALKDAIHVGIQNGQQRKTKQVLRWTRRKQRRHIRTDEIYDYLIDRPSNSVTHSSEANSRINNTSTQPPVVDDLQTFRQALVMDSKTAHSFRSLESRIARLDHENKTPVDVSSYRHSEQLESFVRQQVANQLARKRDYHDADLFTDDFQKPKRTRHS